LKRVPCVVSRRLMALDFRADYNGRPSNCNDG
jgi:hypothetical protein